MGSFRHLKFSHSDIELLEKTLRNFADEGYRLANKMQDLKYIDKQVRDDISKQATRANELLYEITNGDLDV